jgi:hypothetical protein
MTPKHALTCLALLLSTTSCTISHSKQALWASAELTPKDNATFVTEEDSGLMLLGVFTLTEPDHYAVLLERARRQFHCDRMHHAQLDFYTDHWLIVAFPVSRITLICDPDAKVAGTP